MSARDDYPDMTFHARTNGEIASALDEIDRLRENNTHQAEILRAVLPILEVAVSGAMLKINGRWTLVKPKPNEPKEPT